MSRLGVTMTCQNCHQVGHNKKGCKNPAFPKPFVPKRRHGRPSKDDADPIRGMGGGLGGSGSGLGGSGSGSGSGIRGNASGVGGSGSGLGNGSGVGGSGTGLGNGSGVGGSGTGLGNGSGVGGSGTGLGNASGVGGSGSGDVRSGPIKGHHIPGLSFSPPNKRAFNRYGGVRFATGPSTVRRVNPIVKQGWRGWFGDDANYGSQASVNEGVQESQTEMQMPTQDEIPSQTTNEEAQIPLQVTPLQVKHPVRRRLPSQRILKNKLSKSVHGEGSSANNAMNID